MYDCCKLLVSIATLKARIKKNKGTVEVTSESTTTVGEKPQSLQILGKKLALYEGQVVYVEKPGYRGPLPEPTPEKKLRMKLKKCRQEVQEKLYGLSRQLSIPENGSARRR